MDWANERYVRLYTRDSVSWTVMSWEARSLLCLVLRKLDRAGVLELGRHGARGLAAIVGMPPDVTAAALDELLAEGTLELHGETLVMPNFLTAQEARTSDAQRARDHRERRLTTLRQNGKDDNTAVTRRHTPSHPVTASHTPSHLVTPSLATPSLATPSLATPSLATPSQAKLDPPVGPPSGGQSPNSPVATAEASQVPQVPQGDLPPTVAADDHETAKGGALSDNGGGASGKGRTRKRRDRGLSPAECELANSLAAAVTAERLRYQLPAVTAEQTAISEAARWCCAQGYHPAEVGSAVALRVESQLRWRCDEGEAQRMLAPATVLRQGKLRDAVELVRRGEVAGQVKGSALARASPGRPGKVTAQDLFDLADEMDRYIAEEEK